MPGFLFRTIASKGQASSQIRQRRSFFQARQCSRTTSALPGRAHHFSSFGRERIASLGQTWPQAVQAGSQGPVAGVSTGARRPLNPVPRAAGWRVLVGQEDMQAPQRMQRSRKSASGRAPGGRRSGFAAAEVFLVEARRKPPASAQAAPAWSRILRPWFGESVPSGESFRKEKPTASTGQTFTQLRQVMHSEWSVSIGFEAIDRVGQILAQAPHEMQASLTRRRQNGRLENIARSAPVGHRQRHQRRGANAAPSSGIRVRVRIQKRD